MPYYLSSFGPLVDKDDRPNDHSKVYVSQRPKHHRHILDHVLVRFIELLLFVTNCVDFSGFLIVRVRELHCGNDPEYGSDRVAGEDQT